MEQKRRLGDGREVDVSRNRNIRKICGCPRDRWTKCPHPWHFSLMRDGVHHRTSANKVAKLKRGASMTRSVAERHFTAWKASIEKGDVQPKAKPAPARTVGNVLDEYERDFVRQPWRRPDATTDMMWLVNWWQAKLKDRPLADVTAAEVRALIDARHTRTQVNGAKGGRVTSNRLLGRLRHVYNWAIERGYATTSPFQTRPGQPKLRILKAGIESARTRRLRPGEEAKLLESAAGDLKVLVIALLDTALRIGELLALTFGDADLTRGVLTVRAETAKTATGRLVPMTSRVKAIVEARTTAPDGKPHPPSAFVFGNAVGERVHPDAVRRNWEATCKRAGSVDLHLHDLRREAASRLLEAGAALHTVSKWLGHSTVVQTSVYLASTAGHLEDAVKLLEAARTPAPPADDAACKKLAISAQSPAFPDTGDTPASSENLSIH